MRLQKVILLITGICVLLSTGGTTEASQLSDIKDELAERVSIIKRYHKRNSKNLVKAAQKEVFQKYFKAETDAEREKFKQEIDKLSLHVQTKTQVDEMCFIDKRGREISRIVFTEVAPDNDLSKEEASAPFFKPSFAKKGKEVHIQPPYMSADSLRWVICYATPIVLDDGTKPAIYHYEMPLSSVHVRVKRGMDKDDEMFLLLVNKDGYIMSDSREKMDLFLKKDDKEMKAPKSDYFSTLKDSSLKSIANKIMTATEGSDSYSADGKDYNVVFGPTGYFGWTAVLVDKKK